MSEVKQVVLLTTEALSPYNVNEVFSVGEAEAKAILATGKVVKYDDKNKDHVAALNAQRGKTEDEPAKA